MGIMAILIGLLLCFLPRAHRDEALTLTYNQLKRLTLATHLCNDVYRKLPPATGWFGQIVRPNETSVGGIGMTAHVYLLPFIVQDFLYRRIVAGEVTSNPPPAESFIGSVVVFPLLLPQDMTQIDNGAGVTNFAANLRVFSDLGWDTRWDAQIAPMAGLNPRSKEPWYYGAATIESIRDRDGTSNTMAFTTQYSICGADAGARHFFNSAGLTNNSPFFGYYAPVTRAARDLNSNDGAGDGFQGEIFQVQPTQRDCNPSYTPQSLSARVLTVSLFDGSVRCIRPDVSTQLWGLLVQPNDGLPMPREWED